MTLLIDPSGFEPFLCDAEPARESVYIRPVGELDVATVPVVAERLQELRDAGFTRLVVDLRNVSFAGSCALRLLLSWTEDARSDGFAFQVTPGPPAVQRLFEITRTAELLDFVEQCPPPPRW